MGDEMKQAETGMPSLTLEPDFAPEVKKEPEVQVQGQLMEVAPEMDPVQQKMAQTVLTPEEQKMVDDFASKIDVENLTQVMQYGAGTQKKMADFSDEALKNVRAQDLGEVGELLSGVVGELKGFCYHGQCRVFDKQMRAEIVLTLRLLYFAMVLDTAFY